MSIDSVMLSNHLILCCSLLLLLLIFPNIRIFSSELALHIRSNFAIFSWSMKIKSKSHSVVSNSLWPHRLYSPWDSPGQNAGVHSLSLLQGILPTQGSNPGLPHCRQILYQLSHEGSPIARLNFIYLFWLYLCNLSALLLYNQDQFARAAHRTQRNILYTRLLVYYVRI